MIHVAIVEDDAKFHAAIVATIEGADDMTLVGAATTLASGMDLLELEPPDVLVVDLGLPDGSGIDLIEAASFMWRQCEIMVSSIFGDEAHVIAAIEAGATGYMLKDNAPAVLVEDQPDYRPQAAVEVQGSAEGDRAGVAVGQAAGRGPLGARGTGAATDHARLQP
jgi:response regulator of citrate/malate metabolism